MTGGLATPKFDKHTAYLKNSDAILMKQNQMLKEEQQTKTTAKKNGDKPNSSRQGAFI